MASQAPQFAAFVSSVEGRLMHRWDAPQIPIGARVIPEREREADGPAVEWDTQKIIPLTVEFVRRFGLELREAIRNGDLRQRTAEEYARQLKSSEPRAPAQREDSRR
jgi:hypothetical protein